MESEINESSKPFILSQIHSWRQRSYSCFADAVDDVTFSAGVQRWHTAFRKLRSNSIDVGLWSDFPISELKSVPAIRHRYSALKKKWIQDVIRIKFEKKSFDRGAMRECFRMKKFPTIGDWSNASNYVAKRYLSSVDKSVYFDDVRLQMEAKLWGEAFNRQNPPKKVDIFQLSVLELPADSNECTFDENMNSTTSSGQRSSRQNSSAPRSSAEATGNSTSSFFHIERYMEGEYRKYNSNSGFVDKQLRNTPHAFSHFTFERSGHRVLVVDIQGVGDLYTDPQIHTADGVGYNDGNLGPRGMALFFHTHRCNPVCHWLGLTAFDLSSSELLLHGTQSDCDDETVDEITDSLSPSQLPCLAVSGDGVYTTTSGHRKRTSSLSQTSYPASRKTRAPLFGPTIVRSAEMLAHNRSRALSDSSSSSVSELSVSACESVSNLVGCPNEDIRRQMSLDSSWILTRKRLPSGDSGFSCRLNFTSPQNPCLSISTDAEEELAHDDAAVADSPFSEGHHGAGPRFSWSPSHLSFSGLEPSITCGSVSPLVFGLGRRMRTVSESSDVDADEVHRLLGNSLHQFMHETHKPSGAGHPSNLDQEIGQSVLGQLHHELARLHEAGRFILDRPGGWSRTGIGGLLDHSDHFDSTKNGSSNAIDWTSVIFHERLAAQLGCLEALIVMSHFHLGLPTQLLSDCPIKPKETDLGVGVDYLWRAAEGGDRRCMILLARYLDTSVHAGEISKDPASLALAYNLLTTPVNLLFLPASADNKSYPLPQASVLASPEPWSEAFSWYKHALNAAASSPIGDAVDEGLDAEGRYDAADDLLPLYRLLARMAEMCLAGGYGLQRDPTRAGELFTEAAESAMTAMQGRLAAKYFELADRAYAETD